MNYQCPSKPNSKILVTMTWHKRNRKAIFLGAFTIGENIWFALKGIDYKKDKVWFLDAGYLGSISLLDDNINELKKIEDVMTT